MRPLLRRAASAGTVLAVWLAAGLALSSLPAHAQEVLRTFQETQPDAAAGSSVAIWTDLNGDGHDEWVVGARLHDTTATDAGRVTVLSGFDSQVLQTWDGSVASGLFGSALANVGDVDKDGVDDLAIGAGGARTVVVRSGATLAPIWSLSEPAEGGFGLAVAGADIDGDGHSDVIVGASNALANAGRVHVFSGATGLSLYAHTEPGLKALGFSVANAGDMDGDGLDDVIAGAPYSSQSFGNEGAAIVLVGPNGTLHRKHTPGGAQDRGGEFGFAVAGVGDLDGDGTNDYAVTARYYGWIHYIEDSYVKIFSGATQAVLWSATGEKDSFFGHSMVDAGDLDFDGGRELLVCDPERSIIYCYSPKTNTELFRYDAFQATGTRIAGGSIAAGGDVNGDFLPDFVFGAPDHPYYTFPQPGSASVLTYGCPLTTYCTAKVNSQGCTPSIFVPKGYPSAAMPVSFRIKAKNVVNNKSGILIYGYGAASTPFQGGTLCIASPIRRTPVQSSAGNPPPNDCSGVYSYDFNEKIRSGSDPQLVPGQAAFAQYWSRDAASPPVGTGLTDAVSFTICP